MKPVKRKHKKVNLNAERKHVCVACNKESFQYNCLLKYHIRQHHFNRIGLAPYADTQNVNDAWVEKVENTDTLVNIKKVSNNELLIQKVKDDTITPTKMKREVIDVRKHYPVCSSSEGSIVECRVCQKNFERKELSKHFAAKHTVLVKKRCDACKTPFRRLFNCASHVCPASSINTGDLSTIPETGEVGNMSVCYMLMLFVFTHTFTAYLYLYTWLP